MRSPCTPADEHADAFDDVALAVIALASTDVGTRIEQHGFVQDALIDPAPVGNDVLSATRAVIQDVDADKE